jgi:hypothetical protein
MNFANKVYISCSSFQSIWLRYELRALKLQLKALEKKVAEARLAATYGQRGITLTQRLAAQNLREPVTKNGGLPNYFA